MLIAGLTASAIGGCALPDGPGGESGREPQTHVAETENFVLLSPFRKETAYATQLEMQYQALSTKLDFSLPKRIIYYRGVPSDCSEPYCEREDVFEFTCRGAGDFCPFYRARIYAEQVGDAPAFLRDGLAEVIAGGLAYRAVLGSPRPARDIVNYFEDDHYQKVRAPLESEIATRPSRLMDLHDQLGRLARTMIDDMTLDGFLAFYRSGSRSLDRWEPETGRSLEEWAAAAAARTPDPISDRGYRLAVAACLAPPIESGDVKRWEASLAEPRLYGPGILWRTRGRMFSFALAERSDVTVRMRAPADSGFAVEPCFFAPKPRLSAGLGFTSNRGEIERTETLEPGSYFLFARGYRGGAQDMGVELRFRIEEVEPREGSLP